MEQARGVPRRFLPARPRRAELAPDLPARLPAPHRAAASSTRRRPSASAARSRSGSGTPPPSTATTASSSTSRTASTSRWGRPSRPNQTEFYAGTLQFNQYLFNLDARREFEVGLSGPLNVAVGAELRRENYQIGAGEPASYAAGTSRDQFGNQAPLGAQVFPGFRPANEVDENRDNVAAYVDLEGNVVGRLRLGLAGRYEHYSDFGSTGDGKLTVRFEPVTHLILRGAASTGFRAPSLGQSFFSSTATNFVNVPGQGLVPFESLTMPVGSAAGPGARRRSRSSRSSRPTSAAEWSGIRSRAFEATVDFYRIKISDRVVLSGNFNQPRVADLLRPFGANSGRFFTNAIDTVTKGVELTARYRFEIGSAGRLGLSGSYAGRSVATATARIRITPRTSWERSRRRRSSPASRPRCSTASSAGASSAASPRTTSGSAATGRSRDWSASVLASRYGEFCSFTADAGRRPDLRREVADRRGRRLQPSAVHGARRRAEPVRRVPGPEHARELVQRDPDLSEPQPVRDERAVLVWAGVAEVLRCSGEASGIRSH